MLLDANSESLATGSAAAFRPPQTAAPEDVPLFKGLVSGTGNYFMRSMANAGRSISMAASVIPNVLDEFVGKDNLSGTSLTDQYYKMHDEVFGRAVDYWTPKPGEVGAAGMVMGELSGGIVQFLANPALLIGAQQIGAAEDLVRQGVPASAAVMAGEVAGLSTTAGIAIPIFGKNLGQRIATGIVGNVGLNVPEAMIKRDIVNAAVPGAGEQFDPWDMRARTVDLLMGAVFGAKAHLDARYEAGTRDALMALNAARALEEGALPGRPATPDDITNAVERVKTAIDQMARGEPVTVPPPDVGGLKPDPVREGVASAIEQMVVRQFDPASSVFDKFEAEVVDRLNALSRTPAGANESYGRLTREFYEATAERLGISPQEMVNKYALRIEGEGEGTFAQGPRTDWIELRPFEGNDRPNPLSPFVAREGITGAQGRLTRAVERADDIGGPDNPRMVFEKDGQKLVIGKLTTQDWVERVQRNLSPDEIKAARAWYGDLHRLMAQFFGEADAERYALAWLLSQQNESPSGGMRNVLRAADMVRGLPEIKKAGLAQGKLLETLRGQLPREGYDAKLLDFIDSELRRSTRTVMGDDPRGGQPAVIDVWANRDVGKVDDRTLKYIADTFGEEAAKHVQIDGTGIGETDYEFGSKFYNRLVEEMNAAGVDGGNWLPLEAQAVGWVAMQKQLGAKPEFPLDIFDKNTRRVSVGLAPGGGTGLKAEVPVQAAQRVFGAAAEATGVKIRAVSVGRGAYLGDGETAVQIDIMGSPEAMQDFAAVVGHALKQTEVIISRPMASGKTGGVTLTEVEGGKLTSMKAVADFMEAVRAKLPKGSTIADGYQVGVIDGRPVIRMFHGVYDEAAGRVKWDGSWKSKERAAFDRAVHEVANEKGIALDFTESKFDIVSEHNDWTKQPAGEAYRDSLAGRGRSVLAERLGNDEFRLLPEELSGQQSVEFQQGSRGNASFGPDITQQPSVIRLLADADLSTYLHENGHLFLEVYADIAARGTNAAIGADMKTLIDWFGVKDFDTWKNMTPEQRRPYHEQFAKGFEAYLRDGQAPTPGLRGIFSQFRDWLVSVYRSLSDLGVEPTPEVRGVFDRMLGGKAEPAPKLPIDMPEMRPRPIPKLSDWTDGEGVDGYALHIADKTNAESIATNGLRAASDGYVYLWKGGLDADSNRIMREARQSKNPDMTWDQAGAVPESYFAVDLSGLKDRIETDPYTGEVRVKGDIPPHSIVKLDEKGNIDPNAPPRFADDMQLPTGQFDESGAPKTVSANALIARLEADAAEIKLTAESFMQAAAGCLLGAI
jgi:hypothetical protein